MTSLAERMRRVTVTATSPDRTVTVTLDTRQARFRVSPTAIAVHNERSFGHAATQALTRALDGHGQAGRELAKAHPETHPETPATQAMRDRIAALDTTAESPARLARIRWQGPTAMSVSLLPRALDSTDHTRLADELDAAFAAVGTARRRELMTAHAAVYGPPPIPEGLA